MSLASGFLSSSWLIQFPRLLLPKPHDEVKISSPPLHAVELPLFPNLFWCACEDYPGKESGQQLF